MPILTLVVPQLKSSGLSWTLTGRSTARQCLIERGLLPVLAAPSPSGVSSQLMGRTHHDIGQDMLPRTCRAHFISAPPNVERKTVWAPLNWHVETPGGARGRQR